jgi:hypothetical protein
VTRFRLALAASTCALLLALSFAMPAAAAESRPGPAGAHAILRQAESSGSDFDVVPVVLWTIVAVLILCILGGTFYLLKRRVGAFPRNPTWVAPISIMESKTFPDEGDFGDAPPVGTHH